MRLWTLHPKYLDAKGLVAAWREALLAQKVLAGGTRGYVHHPQLQRFRAARHPRRAIASFLAGIAEEAERRGCHFNSRKIGRRRAAGRMAETEGQLLHEWKHLRRKLRLRAPQVYRQTRRIKRPAPHPLFRIVAGKVRDWEKT